MGDLIEYDSRGRCRIGRGSLGKWLALVVAIVFIGVSIGLFVDIYSRLNSVASGVCPSSPSLLYSADFADASFDEAAWIAQLAFQTDGANFTANDGLVNVSVGKGLVVDSSVFLSRAEYVFDHTKWLAVTNDTFDAPQDGSALFVEALMSGYTTGIVAGAEPVALQEGIAKYAAGLVDATSDPRLACVALNFIDYEHAMVYDFLMTNGSIWALYEHLPFDNSTEVFTYAKRVAARPSNVSEPVLLRISYNYAKQTVEWMVNGAVVFSIDKLGLPLADRSLLVNNGRTYPAKPVVSTKFQAGFGTFSLLDFLPFEGNGDSRGLANIVGFPRFERNSDVAGNFANLAFVYNDSQMLDGQGAVLVVKSLHVGVSCH